MCFIRRVSNVMLNTTQIWTEKVRSLHEIMRRNQKSQGLLNVMDPTQQNLETLAKN